MMLFAAAKSPVVARNRHAAAVADCPLLRDERTCRQRCFRTAFDPLQKWGRGSAPLCRAPQ